MYKIKIIFISFILIFSILKNQLFSQDSIYVFPSQNNVCVNLIYNISKDNSFLNFSYQISSLECSEQPIWEFRLERNSETLIVESPSNWSYFNSDLRYKTISWATSDTANFIFRNENLTGFTIRSVGLPSICKYFISGYTPIPVFPLGEEPALVVNNDIFENSFQGITVGPKDIPDIIFMYEYIDVILGYVDSSYQFDWIRNQETRDKYNTFLTNAKSTLEQGDTNLTRTHLQSIITNVDIDSSSSLTSEAYALLKFNTEYLLDQLPEINIEDMFDILLNHVSECYNKEWIDNKGIMNSLTKKVERAKTDYLKGKIKTAINKLNSFRNELDAQKDKHLNSECYDLLFSYSNYIIEKLQ